MDTNTQIPALEQLHAAFDELEEWGEVTSVPEHLHPSALLLVYDPAIEHNARARINGHPGALVQVLLLAAADPRNAEFARALQEGMSELMAIDAN